MIAERGDRVGDLLVVGRHRAPFTRGDDLARVEAEAADVPQRAAGPAGAGGAERARRVLDERERRELLDPAGPAEVMHRHDRLGARPDGDPPGIDVHRQRVDVDEHRAQAGQRNDVGGRREGVRRDEHLVARLEVERQHRQVERRRAGRDRDRVAHLAARCQQPLELLDQRPHGQGAAFDHRGERVELLGPDVGTSEADRL